jgi:PAS domain S-box-containing protein
MSAPREDSSSIESAHEGKRPSLIGRMPGGISKAVEHDERVEAELKSLHAQRLLDEGPTAEITHAVLALVVAVLAWPTVEWPLLVTWVGAVVFVTVVRSLARHRLAHKGAAPERVFSVMRSSAAAQGLAWGVGVLLFAHQLPFQDLAIIMVIFAGLVGGAIVTFSADPISFHLSMGTLVGPLAVAVLLNGQDRSHLVSLALIMLFVLAMTRLHQHSYDALAGYVRVLKRLEISQEETSRERSYLDSLLTSAPNAIVTLDRKGGILGVNPAFESMFGYDAVDLIGRDITAVFEVDPSRGDAHVVEALVSSGAVVVDEVERKCRDGSKLTVRVSAAPVKGVADGVSFVMYDDITAMKQAQTAVRSAEEQYRELVESAVDLVWQVDLEGRWTFMNAASERIYGARVDDLLGQPLVGHASSEHRSEDEMALQKVLTGSELTDYDTVHCNVAGEPKHLSFSARPVRTDEGAIVGARGIARDVSERAAALEAMERAREAAERAAEARSAFLANMSHEIRTPMNGVLGMTEVLLDTELTQEQRQATGLVRSSAEALLRIIDDTLDFSKIEGGRFELEAIPFDLPGLLDSTVRPLAVRAVERRVEIVYEVKPDVPHMVIGDPGRLRQVLTNLAGNAVKFTHEGEVVVTVLLEGRTGKEGLIRFTVKDTGIGIPAEQIDGIFAEFSQADISTTRKYGGTGLGLAISRRIVRLMGGDITVSSEVDVGSEFTFVIPLVIEAEHEVTAGTHYGMSLSGLRALVIADKATNRRMVREMLELAGVEVEEADSGKAGIDALKQAVSSGAPRRLAIVEAHMAGLDGFEVARAVQSDPDLSGTKFMMLTSAGMRGDARRCRELGISAYLPKPISRFDLLEAAAVLAESDTKVHPGGLITRHTIDETRRRLSILLAEDNPVNQQVAATMLRKRGHHVEIVPNGREAVRTIAAKSYDVILMDVQMPELDGVSATEEIRRSGNNLPIIAVTAHAMAGDRDRCLAAGMTGYISKPFKPHELFAAVEGWSLSSDGRPEEGKVYKEPPVDIEGFRSSMREAGVEDAVQAMIETFLQDAPRRMEELERAVAAGDADRVQKGAHPFKSAAGMIGARRLAELLKQIESMGRDKEVDRAREMLRPVLDEYRAVLDFLEASIEGTGLK